jgi:hypothetical protein
MAIKKLATISIIILLVASTIQVALPMARAEIFGDPFLVAVGGTAAVTSGAVGTQVDVVGNVTSGAAGEFALVTVYWDSLVGTVLGSVEADGAGAYRTTVTIPSATAGTHWIIVNDGETESGGAQITVTPILTVSSIPASDPALALPGDDLIVTGQGYAPNDDITLFLNLTTNPATNYVITAPVLHTSGSGTFSGIITVPPIPVANFGTYVFYAADEAGNYATDTVTIEYYITCYPASGPTGIEILMMGRIAPEVAYDLRFDGAVIGTGTTDSTGSYFETYTIPAVSSPGTYTVEITWGISNSRSTTFIVTAVLPQLTISFDAPYDADAYSSDCRVIIDGNSYYHGDVVSLSGGSHTCEAFSPADWGFLQWNVGDNNWVSVVENPSTMLTVTGNGVFGASWGPLVTFVTTPSNGGTITVQELGENVAYSSGQSAIMTPNSKFLTANPAPGYTFQSWSSTCGPIDVSGETLWTPTEPGTLTAVFSPHESSYSLNITSDYGSPSPGVGVNVYDSGSSVTVSVNSPVTIGDTVWTCTGWSGYGSVPSSGSGTGTSFTITQDSEIIWLWEPVLESNEQIIPEFSTGIAMLLIFIVFTLVLSIHKKAKTNFIL